MIKRFTLKKFKIKSTSQKVHYKSDRGDNDTQNDTSRLYFTKHGAIDHPTLRR